VRGRGRGGPRESQIWRQGGKKGGERAGSAAGEGRERVAWDVSGTHLKFSHSRREIIPFLTVIAPSSAEAATIAACGTRGGANTENHTGRCFFARPREPEPCPRQGRGDAAVTRGAGPAVSAGACARDGRRSVPSLRVRVCEDAG
jgi:hypothetical protein